MTLANSSALSQEKIDRIFNFLTTGLLGKASIACSIASKVLVSTYLGHHINPLFS